MSSNHYEKFRSALTMKLCSVCDAEQISKILQAVDQSLQDYEINRKSMDIIPAVSSETPEIVKIYIASKAIANLSKKSLYQYKLKLQDFFLKVHKAYSEITTNDIRMYLYHYKEEHGISDNYLNTIRVTLNGFFSWLVTNEYIQRNPCSLVDKVKFQQPEREPMTPYEMELYRWNTKDVREKAIIDFLYSTGLRLSECASVKLTDINWQNRSVKVHHGKGDKARIVFFDAEAEVSMREYLKSREDNTDALFVSRKKPHQALTGRALEVIVRKVGERINIGVYPHRLRHTFATRSLQAGMSIENLQKLLGHSKTETTLIYAKIDPNDIRSDYKKVYAS